MQRKQRDTTIFSLSALDLFCSAMGVFMVLCFIVFPFYKKDSPTPAPPQPQPVQPPPPPAPHKQVIAGLTIAMKWEAPDSRGQETSCDDMDLHVRAKEKGKAELHYFYKARKHASSPAMLVTDSIRGGNEVWVHPAVSPGEYKVSYLYYDKHANYSANLNMRLVVIYGSGETKEFAKVIPPGSIRPDQNREYPWVTIKVREDGSVDFQEN